MRKVNVLKAYEKLNDDMTCRLEDVMTDDGLTVEDLTIEYLIREVLHGIKMNKLALDDCHEGDEEYVNYIQNIKENKKWYSYYKRYENNED